MELVLIAQLLLALTDTLVLRGELSGLEPKRLRYRALHTAGRLGFHARRATLRLERRWPWAEELAAAFALLSRSRPQPGRKEHHPVLREPSSRAPTAIADRAQVHTPLFRALPLLAGAW